MGALLVVSRFLVVAPVRPLFPGQSMKTPPSPVVVIRAAGVTPSSSPRETNNGTRVLSCNPTALLHYRATRMHRQVTYLMVHELIGIKLRTY